MSSSDTLSLDRATLQAWLEGFHKSSATLDAQTWLDKYMTEDFALQYANMPAFSGRQTVIDFFAKTFEGLDVMIHTIDYFDFVSPRLYQGATIRYVVKGDDPDKDDIVIPSFGTFYMRQEDQLRCYRAEIFLDPSEILKRSSDKGFA